MRLGGFRQNHLLQCGLFLARLSTKCLNQTFWTPPNWHRTQCCPSGICCKLQPKFYPLLLLTLPYLLNALFYLDFKSKGADLFFFITQKCYMLILMHSNVTNIKCREGKFGLEFLTQSVALPINLANVKNVLRNVNYRKTPICQNAQGMGGSRSSQELTRKSFSH